VMQYASVDGVIQAPGHADEDRDGGFAHGGWTGPFMGDHGRYTREALNVMGALLLGRRTYDIWAGYWPTVADPADEIARMLNRVPKYVASGTLAAGTWPRRRSSGTSRARSARSSSSPARTSWSWAPPCSLSH
jgi:dihydrofolate reductase